MVAHLILFHCHLAFVSVAMESSGDLPDPLTRSDPLDKVGWEKSHLVLAFPLANRTESNIHKHPASWSTLICFLLVLIDYSLVTGMQKYIKFNI